jgi:hypothetical protein
MGTKSKENDRKGKQKGKKLDPKNKKRSDKKHDGFDPSPALTLALLDEDWNYAEWQAFSRATKDYISKNRALRKRSAAAMSSASDEVQTRVTFAETVDQFTQTNRRAQTGG